MQVPVVKGVANFFDLGLTNRGDGYVLMFESTMGAFSVETTVNVSYTPEYQVTSEDMYPRDFFGESVDIEGDWAVVGAPFAHKATRAVQAITTSGAL